MAKVLRARDGEPAKASTESALRAAKAALGFDVLAPECPMLDFVPSRHALAVSEERMLTEHYLQTLALADMRTRATGVEAQGAAAPGADTPRSNPGHARRRLGGPLLGEGEGPLLPRAMRAAHTHTNGRTQHVHDTRLANPAYTSPTYVYA